MNKTSSKSKKAVVKKTVVKSSRKKKKKLSIIEVKEKGLNPQREFFCQLYASNREFFGNGVQSYAEAYNIDLSEKGAHASARQCAYALLTNVDVLRRIDEIMQHTVLNDQFVDKQLGFVIQQNGDLPSKVAAMREYNKLKNRITEKLDLTSQGKQVKGITIVKHASNN